MASRALHATLLSIVVAACNAGASTSDGNGAAPPAGDPGGDSGAGSNASSSGDEAGGGTTSDAGTTSTGDAATLEVEPGPPHVQWIGRFDESDPASPRCAYPGCRIVIRFDGTKVTAKLQDEYESWQDAAPSEWDVIVDGTTKPKIVMSLTAQDFVLADGLAKGPHVVELYKRSGPEGGTTKFLGIDLAGGALLSPPVRKTRHIEIVGDSSASGFGVEGVADPETRTCPGGVDHAAKYQNFRKAYGAVLGEMVSAEVFGTTISGKGISQNNWAGDTRTLPVMFLRTLPNDDQSTWSFAKWQPDLVVVMAGGNDFEIVEPPGAQEPATLETFTEGYRQFVATLRSSYPQAHLVLSVSPTATDDWPPGANTRTNIITGANTVMTERNGQGDAKVYFFEPGQAVPAEKTACSGHGNAQLHQRVAAELAAFVKPTLGW